MGRTTDEWAALLDGTADGPWEVKHHGDDLVASICTTVHDPKRYVGDMYGEWNARLAAAAPDAVAEVIRLRRELEELREVFVRAAEMMGKFEIPADRQQAQGFAGRITRILEATDE